MIWSPEKWFIPRWPLLFASPMVTRTLAAVAPGLRSAGTRANCTSPYDLISPEEAEKGKMAKWREGPAQPFEKAQFTEGKSFDFASPSLDFPSPRLGFSFPKAWIFLP